MLLILPNDRPLRNDYHCRNLIHSVLVLMRSRAIIAVLHSKRDKSMNTKLGTPIPELSQMMP